MLALRAVTVHLAPMSLHLVVGAAKEERQMPRQEAAVAAALLPWAPLEQRVQVARLEASAVLLVAPALQQLPPQSSADRAAVAVAMVFSELLAVPVSLVEQAVEQVVELQPGRLQPTAVMVARLLEPLEPRPLEALEPAQQERLAQALAPVREAQAAVQAQPPQVLQVAQEGSERAVVVVEAPSVRRLLEPVVRVGTARFTSSRTSKRTRSDAHAVQPFCGKDSKFPAKSGWCENCGNGPPQLPAWNAQRLRTL